MQFRILRFQPGMKHRAGKASAKLPLRSKESIVQNAIETGHTQEECWGTCKWCKKTNHPSDRCFNKPKDEENVEKVNKTKKKPNKKKKKAKVRKSQMRTIPTRKRHLQ